MLVMVKIEGVFAYFLSWSTITNNSSYTFPTELINGLFEKYNIDETRLEDQPYFHGKLPREELSDVLHKDGDFILRETDNPKAPYPMVVSVFWEGSIRSLPVEQDFSHNAKWKLGSCEKTFKFVTQVILYCYKKEICVTPDKVKLLKAVPRDKYQLNHEDIILGQLLGEGNFGDVMTAKQRFTEGDKCELREVAIKRCKENMPEDEKRRFMQEARRMKRYHHANVVQLIGICIQQDPIMIVMEIMPNGALDSYLQKRDPRSPSSNKRLCTITKLQLSQWCLDSANGMEYLAAHKCIHRDLAARNVLLDANLVAKIADFGLSREGSQYQVDKVRTLPLKWLAPESFGYATFTTKCDVWSYGILMWEAFEYGKLPYPDLQNKETMTMINNGYRMPPPDDMPESVAAIMKQCWEKDPDKRPDFKSIKQRLEKAVRGIKG